MKSLKIIGLLFISPLAFAGSVTINQGGGTGAVSFTAPYFTTVYDTTGTWSATQAFSLISFDTEDINGTFIGLGRNRILNPEILIDQVNAGSTTANIAASGVYGPDGFRGDGTAASGLFRMQRSSSTPPTGFLHYLHIYASADDGTIAAGDRYIVRQFMEGYAVRDFLFGSASAQTITLSFWARSSLTGTYCVGFLNGAANRNYISEYTIDAANTWEFKTITLTGDVTGTWAKENTEGLVINWVLAAGSTFQGTANTWQAGNLYATSNQANLMGGVGRTFDITGIQLELGSVATSFEYRSFQLEVEYCKRYFTKSWSLDTLVGANTSVGIIAMTLTTNGGGVPFSQLFFPTRMRASPTIVGYTSAGVAGNWAYARSGATGTTAMTANSSISADQYSFQMANVGANFVAVGIDGHWTADIRF